MTTNDIDTISYNIYNFIDKHVKSKIKNSKFYCITFLFEILTDNNIMVSNFYKQYGKSQLLFTFFASTLINNMFYRALIIRTCH